MHEGGGRWVGSNKLVEPKKKKTKQNKKTFTEQLQRCRHCAAVARKYSRVQSGSRARTQTIRQYSKPFAGGQHRIHGRREKMHLIQGYSFLEGELQITKTVLSINC